MFSSISNIVGVKILCIAIMQHLRDPNMDSSLAFTTSSIILGGVILGLGVSIYKFADWIGAHAFGDPDDPDDAAAIAFAERNPAYIRSMN